MKRMFVLMVVLLIGNCTGYSSAQPMPPEQSSVVTEKSQPIDSVPVTTPSGTPSKAPSTDKPATFLIDLTASSELPDQKGTDVTNIYNINIDFANKNAAADQRFTVIYFLDNVFLEEFKNQTLPFSFQRNYKAIAQGPHIIRIEIEDAAENPLAQGTVAVNTLPSASSKLKWPNNKIQPAGGKK